MKPGANGAGEALGLERQSSAGDEPNDKMHEREAENLAPQGAPNSAASADITVIGGHRSLSGIGEAGRQTLRAIAAAGLAAEGIDVSEHGLTSRNDESCASLLRPVGTAPLQIFNINASDLPFVLSHHREQLGRGRLRVCIPFWELSTFPAEWVANLNPMDEVWAPSRFIHDALARNGVCPVRHMPIPVEVGTPSPLPRERFGLPGSRFLFFFAFDFLSFVERKNPAAAIAAFRRAFPDGGGAGLVLKCINSGREPEKLARLLAEIDGHPDIFLIDRPLSRGDMLGLMAATDALLSLHRSEGFGLLVAEAMLLGKPVIATDYSATQELLSPQTGFPVRCELIDVKEGEYPFGDGQRWANPDVDHAAWLMRRLRDKPGQGDRRAANAGALVRERHSLHNVGRLIRKRTEELRRA